MKKIIIFSTIILFFNVLFFGFVSDSYADSVYADSVFVKSGQKLGIFAKTDLAFSDFDTSVSGIIRNVMLIVNTVFFIFMIYAGILWLISAGNESKIEKAKSILMWCVIGIFVTFGSYAITDFVLKRVQGWQLSGGGGSKEEGCTELGGECKRMCDISTIDGFRYPEIGYGALDCKGDTVCCVPNPN